MRGILAVHLACAACSVVPPRQWPTHDERRVVATFAANGAAIELPVSSPFLTVVDLSIEPAPARDWFADGRRYIEPAESSPVLTVRYHYRAYGRDGEPPPAPRALFPHALTVEDQ